MKTDDEIETTGAKRLIERRTVVRTAAWSVPVIALAVAAPMAAASGDIDLGAYQLTGTCGILGVVGPGFTLTAGPAQPLPVGTTVVITGSGVANIGVFSVTGGTASVSVLSGTSRQITLTSALAAGATLAFRTTLSITVAFTLNAVASIPTGYAATGGKAAASVSSTLVLCSAT
ncbi:hypothetical protein [Subtercola boreus]|uniref:hypothetical protein n=1 Tax=Subtercola boreus TaxID=120213 RepID=UPI000E2FA9AD|nr:hypothetical protein [Subtercola boreus]TQL54054.1 hypothetical protein FB464_1581 [Subtercola boreus]